MLEYRISPIMITKIISGGQTGADRGGLDAAIHCKLPHGGWCPKGRKAEDDIIPVEYHLTEMESDECLARTQANVIDSHATLILTHGLLSGGSLKTGEYAHYLEKPYHVIDLLSMRRSSAVTKVVQWLSGDTELTDHDEYQASPPVESTLNVAGSRESQALGIQEDVFCLLVNVLIEVNPACKNYYRFAEAKRVMRWFDGSVGSDYKKLLT